jgi:hypothetical protein
MNLEDLKDKNITMIVRNTEQEDDVQVFLGKLRTIDGGYAFVNDEEGWKVSLDEEQLSRLRPVEDEVKEILLNADYAFSMLMSDLPQTDS